MGGLRRPLPGMVAPLPRLHERTPIANLHASARRSRIRIVEYGAAGPSLASPIDWPSTILAKGRAPLVRHHLRVRRTVPLPTQRHIFLLDCSASMIERSALARAKGLLLVWLRAIRRGREQAALICYGGDQADVRFGPAVPSGWNEAWIDPIGGGGGTPLALGVQSANALVHKRPERPERRIGRDAAFEVQHCLIVLTDGRTHELPPRPEGYEQIVIIDFETQMPSLHRCQRLATLWNAQCVAANALTFI